MIILDNKDLIVIDVETSGVNPFIHEVLAVGLVPLKEGLPSKLVYIRPETINWSPYAKRNFDRFASDWNDKAISPKDACETIDCYLEEVFSGRTATPIGHNIGFDVAFLRRLAFLGGRDSLNGVSHRSIDTHTLLYLLALEGKIPDWATNSDDAFKYFNIDIADQDRHTALGDATATKQLLLRVFDMLGVGN